MPRCHAAAVTPRAFSSALGTGFEWDEDRTGRPGAPVVSTTLLPPRFFFSIVQPFFMPFFFLVCVFFFPPSHLDVYRLAMDASPCGLLCGGDPPPPQHPSAASKVPWSPDPPSSFLCTPSFLRRAIGSRRRQGAVVLDAKAVLLPRLLDLWRDQPLFVDLFRVSW